MIHTGKMGFCIWFGGAVLILSVYGCHSHGDGSNFPKYAASSQGAPWPAPQRMSQMSQLVNIDAGNFQFHAVQESCDILDAAFVRYRDLTFNSRPGSGKLYFKPRSDPRASDEPLSVLGVTVASPCQNRVFPSLTSDESYVLDISPTKAELVAKEVWGALRGLETFSQLVVQQNTGKFVVNITHIDDYPRFAHRGLLLDTSRHYVALPILLDNLEAMAQNKYNVFHWHIVDDQSFPFQSQSFPALSDAGAYDPVTHVYTPSDVQKVIEFARLRGIRVIPEFDSPGHAQSWGHGQPGLLTACYKQGKPDGSYGPINPVPATTNTFLSQLFSEVASVFTDHYVHLGGDEVSFNCWMSNPQITAFMASKNWTDYGKLEQYYMQNVLDIVNKLKKGYIIWQEVIDNGATVRQDTVVEVWKGGWQNEMGKVTKLGYKTLLASCWYLTYISYGSDWSKYYTCDPQNFTGTPEQKQQVIGGETSMWGEFVDGTNLLSLVWPHAAAVGERLWSAQSVNNVKAATPRLAQHRCRMVRRGFPAEPINGPGYCPKEFRG
ncbi:beta-hexosaminidase subunit alpha-like [Gigantopelta aegis]|uniref:beta-hexosaminidase subunit alpha-like n=1 Tax=Gigantopelta aegis TaxID=1735272 RepID=UPI001B88962A|nr:beta-hexosaminidase subunit alpha-like [Gigantopelta aegis]